MKWSARLALPVVVLALAGCCTTCQTPWDYCSAVLGPSGCPNCDFGARYGSLFHPMYGTPATTPISPTPAVATDANDAAEAPSGEAPLPADSMPDDTFQFPTDSEF